MKKLKYYALIALFSCLSHFPWSQNENSDAVYLQLTKEYTLNPDGSMDFRFIKKLKLLTYRSFNSLYGESTVIYNPAGQELKINEVYTIMADGKKVISPKNALNEVLPGMAVNAPAYNNLREMVITHTGTERNAVLNLDYEIHSKKGFFPALMGNEVLAEAEPVKELTLKVKIPTNVKLYFRMIHSDQIPVMVNDGKFIIFTWKFKDIPAISMEEFQSPNNENYPRLLFSTENDRSDIYTGFQKQPAFAFICNDEMKNAIKEILTTSQEKTDILLKLQEKVVNEFKLWTVPLRFTGFSCRTAAETWHSNGGTQIEKAILLISLLKEAGIAACPVGIIRSSLFDEKIGSLLDIDEFAVRAVLPEKGMVYLSISTLNPQDLKYNNPDRMFVEFDPSGKSTFTKTEDYPGKVTCKFDFNLDEKRDLSGEISLDMVNRNNPWLQLIRDKGKDRTVFTGGIVASDLKDPMISNSDVKESLILFTVQKNKPFRKDSNFSFFTLPVMTKGIESWGIRLLPKNRTTPLEIPSEMEESYEYTFVMPEGMSAFSPDKKLELNNSAGSFNYELKTEKSKVTVKKSIKLKKRIIPVTEYGEFKTLMDSWNNDMFREIIFME